MERAIPMSHQSKMFIEITPFKALVDEKLAICLFGFQPYQRVTLWARVTDDRGTEWVSHAVFETDAEGNLDLSKKPPRSGTYDTVDVMGLLWSMSPARDEDRGASFIQGSKPLVITFTAEIDGEVVASAQAERHYIAPGVSRQEVRENGLAGVFYRPAGAGPFPTVIVLSGSGGGVNEWRAALYAAHGYASFALAYFNYDTLPKNLLEIPLEYFDKAIKWLQAQEGIDAKRIAVAGASRGGELSLLLAATFPQIKAVIAYVPSGFVWGGFGEDPSISGSSWTYKGQPLPFVPYAENQRVSAQAEEQKKNGQPIDLTPGFLAALSAAQPSALDAATIPVEHARAAILMISGKEDQMWPS